MAGAVIVVDPRIPKRFAREGIERSAGRAFREARGRKRNMTLQHTGKTVAHFRGRCADNHRACHVGGAVRILSARIDQVDLVAADRTIARACDAIVRKRGVRRRAGNRIETDVDKRVRCAPVAFQHFRRLDFAQLAARGLSSDPGKKAR